MKEKDQQIIRVALPAKEPAGAISIFSRSEDARKVQYLNYVGDGDTKSFQMVKEKTPNQLKQNKTKKKKKKPIIKENVLATFRNDVALRFKHSK